MPSGMLLTFTISSHCPFHELSSTLNSTLITEMGKQSLPKWLRQVTYGKYLSWNVGV